MRTLDELLKAARDYRMTPEERRRQRISFAYGNTHMENPLITREMAEEADRLQEKPLGEGATLLDRCPTCYGKGTLEVIRAKRRTSRACPSCSWVRKATSPLSAKTLEWFREADEKTINQLAARIVELEGALAKYGVHGPECISFVPKVIRECKCGLERVLARKEATDAH